MVVDGLDAVVDVDKMRLIAELSEMLEGLDVVSVVVVEVDLDIGERDLVEEGSGLLADLAVAPFDRAAHKG